MPICLHPLLPLAGVRASSLRRVDVPPLLRENGPGGFLASNFYQGPDGRLYYDVHITQGFAQAVEHIPDWNAVLLEPMPPPSSYALAFYEKVCPVEVAGLPIRREGDVSAGLYWRGGEGFRTSFVLVVASGMESDRFYAVRSTGVYEGLYYFFAAVGLGDLFPMPTWIDRDSTLTSKWELAMSTFVHDTYGIFWDFGATSYSDAAQILRRSYAAKLGAPITPDLPALSAIHKLAGKDGVFANLLMISLTRYNLKRVTRKANRETHGFRLTSVETRRIARKGGRKRETWRHHLLTSPPPHTTEQNSAPFQCDNAYAHRYCNGAFESRPLNSELHKPFLRLITSPSAPTVHDIMVTLPAKNTWSNQSVASRIAWITRYADRIARFAEAFGKKEDDRDFLGFGPSSEEEALVPVLLSAPQRTGRIPAMSAMLYPSTIKALGLVETRHEGVYVKPKLVGELRDRNGNTIVPTMAEWLHRSFCTECGYYFIENDLLWLGEDRVCPPCFDAAPCCERCDDRVLTRHLRTTDDYPEGGVCRGCYQEINKRPKIVVHKEVDIMLPSGELWPPMTTGKFHYAIAKKGELVDEDVLTAIYSGIATYHSTNAAKDVTEALKKNPNEKGMSISKWVSSVAFKECKLKLAPTTLESVGNLAAAVMDEEGYFYPVHFRNLNAHPASFFLNSGSCWWGSQAQYARNVFCHFGGHAILLGDEEGWYEKKKLPDVRAWMLPVAYSADGNICPTRKYTEAVEPGTQWFLFNTYRNGRGKLARFNNLRVARRIAHILGLSYTKISLDYPDGCFGCPAGIYVNSNTGIFIAPQEKIDAAGKQRYASVTGWRYSR